MLDDTIELAAKLPKINRGGILADAAAAQASIGRFRLALRTAARIDTQISRRFAFEAVALCQAKAGDIKGALSTASQAGKYSYVETDVALIQARHGDVQGARRTLLSSKDDFERGHAFLEIARLQKDHGDGIGSGQSIKDALTAFAEWNSDADVSRSSLLALRAIAQGQAGNIPELLRIVETLEKNFEDPVFDRDQPLQDIAVALAEAGDFGRAVTIAEKIDDADTGADTLEKIAYMRLKQGDDQGAMKMALRAGAQHYWQLKLLLEVTRHRLSKAKLASARQSVAAITDWHFQAEGLAEIAKVEHQMGDQAAAAKTLRAALQLAHARVKDDFFKADCIIKIAHAQGFCRDRRGAAMSLKQAMGIALKLTNDWVVASERESCLEDIARVQIELGALAEARTTLKLALQAVKEFQYGGNSFALRYALRKIAIGFMNAKDLDAALQVGKGATSEFAKRVVFSAIARTQAATGVAPEAIKWLDSVDSKVVKAACMMAIVEGMLERARINYEAPSRRPVPGFFIVN